MNDVGDRKSAYVVLLEELLRVAVRVDVDLRQRVVHGRVLAALLDTRLEPREDELEPVPALNLLDQLVDRKVPRHGRQE